jgi:hypothetical protein
VALVRLCAPWPSGSRFSHSTPISSAKPLELRHSSQRNTKHLGFRSQWPHGRTARDAQLLLEGGQGYDDIASLLGVSPDEVRARARSALTEMGGADPDAQVAVSDFLLGKADPIGRADAVRHLQNDPEANARVRLLTQLERSP